jgi:hypothetical protein
MSSTIDITSCLWSADFVDIFLFEDLSFSKKISALVIFIKGLSMKIIVKNGGSHPPKFSSFYVASALLACSSHYRFSGFDDTHEQI